MVTFCNFFSKIVTVLLPICNRFVTLFFLNFPTASQLENFSIFGNFYFPGDLLLCVHACTHYNVFYFPRQKCIYARIKAAILVNYVYIYIYNTITIVDIDIINRIGKFFLLGVWAEWLRVNLVKRKQRGLTLCFLIWFNCLILQVFKQFV